MREVRRQKQMATNCTSIISNKLHYNTTRMLAIFRIATTNKTCRYLTADRRLPYELTDECVCVYIWIKHNEQQQPG